MEKAIERIMETLETSMAEQRELRLTVLGIPNLIREEVGEI